MTYSISYYLRRKKHIYCTIVMNGLSSSKSTGITVYDASKWTGRYMVDPSAKRAAEAVNNSLKAYDDKLRLILENNAHRSGVVPETMFDLMNGVVKPNNLTEPQTLLEAANYHLKSNNKIKRYSNNSMSVYLKIVESLIPAFLKSLDVSDILLSEFKTRVAKEFKYFLNEKNYSPNSQRLFITFMKSIFKTIMEDFPPDEYPAAGVFSNPFNSRALKTVKGFDKIDNFIHPTMENELWSLLDELESKNKHSIHADRTIMALFLWNTGMSLADTCNNPIITREISSNEEVFIYNRRKTGHEARVIIYPELRRLLDIVEDRKEFWKEKYKNWLPIKYFEKNGDIDKSIYDNQYLRFNKFLKIVVEPRLKSTITPHTMRHSFAVKMLLKGHSMDVVKVMMGHSSVLTTENSYGYILNSKLFNEKRINEKNQSFMKAM